MSKKGLFITFEGADGCGKSTQMEKITQYLLSKDLELMVTKDPGGTDLGKKLREILLGYKGKIYENCELFLYLADRAQHIDEKIIPALKQGKIVLCDRYIDSTLAYQGYGRGLDKDKILELNNIVSHGLIPDLTLYFDVDTEIAMQRIGNDKDRLESEGIEFYKKVREGFLDLAKKQKRIKIIDSAQDIESVFTQVKAEIDKFLIPGKNNRSLDKGQLLRQNLRKADSKNR